MQSGKIPSETKLVFLQEILQAAVNCTYGNKNIIIKVREGGQPRRSGLVLVSRLASHKLYIIISQLRVYSNEVVNVINVAYCVCFNGMPVFTLIMKHNLLDAIISIDNRFSYSLI